MSILIKAMGFPDGTDCPHEGQYLKFFDFEYDHGLGYGEFTSDKKQAKQFKNFAAAMDFWKTQSKIKPLRPDGKPNRPLTALTIALEKYGEDG